MSFKDAGGDRRGEHAAAVIQPRAPHRAKVVQPKAPHPATVMQPKAPHPARLLGPAAGAPRWPGGAVQRAQAPMRRFMLPTMSGSPWGFVQRDRTGLSVRRVDDEETEITIDPALIPHITNTVVTGVNDVPLAKRTAATLMTLSTGLALVTLFDNRTDYPKENWLNTKSPIAAVVVLGNVVLTVAASQRAMAKAKTAKRRILLALTTRQIGHVEANNDDPRHIGSHDLLGDIPGGHFHLVLAAPGLTQAARDDIVQIANDELG